MLINIAANGLPRNIDHLTTTCEDPNNLDLREMKYLIGRYPTQKSSAIDSIMLYSGDDHPPLRILLRSREGPRPRLRYICNLGMGEPCLLCHTLHASLYTLQSTFHKVHTMPISRFLEHGSFKDEDLLAGM